MRIVAPVTREAIPRGRLIHAPRVAVSAFGFAMEPDQRVVGILVVIETAGSPEAAGMAAQAIVAERAPVQLVGVTGRAALARDLPEVVGVGGGLRMTLDARHRDMAAVERKAGAWAVKPGL